MRHLQEPPGGWGSDVVPPGPAAAAAAAGAAMLALGLLLARRFGDRRARLVGLLLVLGGLPVVVATALAVAGPPAAQATWARMGPYFALSALPVTAGLLAVLPRARGRVGTRPWGLASLLAVAAALCALHLLDPGLFAARPEPGGIGAGPLRYLVLASGPLAALVGLACARAAVREPAPRAAAALAVAAAGLVWASWLPAVGASIALGAWLQAAPGGLALAPYSGVALGASLARAALAVATLGVVAAAWRHAPAPASRALAGKLALAMLAPLPLVAWAVAGAFWPAATVTALGALGVVGALLAAAGPLGLGAAALRLGPADALAPPGTAARAGTAGAEGAAPPS